MSPKVSVLMSVYNGEKYLADALDSILNQTFDDFEFIVVDDGSGDATPDFLDRYQRRDARISIHRFDENRGLSSALNFGIRLARGEYVARMDADDISLPDRLQEQVAFMDANSDVGVCGTWAKLTGRHDGTIWRYPISHDAIYARLLFANTLVHPSVMFRRSSLEKQALFYDENIRYAQDYELWSRAIQRLKFANLDRVLIHYRIHEQGTGSKHRYEQMQTHEMIHRRLLRLFDLECTQDTLTLHQMIGLYQRQADLPLLRHVRRWLEAIRLANQKARLISPRALEVELGARWTHICHASHVPLFYLFMEMVFCPLPLDGRKGLHKIWRAARFSGSRLFLEQAL